MVDAQGVPPVTSLPSWLKDWLVTQHGSMIVGGSKDHVEPHGTVLLPTQASFGEAHLPAGPALKIA